MPRPEAWGAVQGSREILRSMLAAAVFAALIVSRHPAILRHASFWAEDGAIWYPDARAHGVEALLWPVVGYLQTTSRLAGLAAQVLPLRWAPTAFAILALLIQVLPPTFLVSGRLRGAWPHLPSRVAFALGYVALPDAEVYVNVTNAQWHLAALAFLIIVSDSPGTAFGRVFDTVFLLLAGVSGPFVLMLAPIAAWQAWVRPSRTSLGRLAMCSVGLAVQLWFIVSNLHTARSAAALGADGLTFAEILTRQVFLPVILDPATARALVDLRLWQSGALPVLIAASGATLSVYAFAVGPPLLRRFCLFAGAVLAAALLHPQASMDQPQWPVLTQVGAAGRYFFFPMLAFLGVLLATAAARARPVRWLALGLLAVAAIRLPANWPIVPSPEPSRSFVAQARQFEAAPAGTRMEFPIRPPGWSMTLTK